MNPAKMLIIRFGGIGECAMTAWAVSDLRATYPDAHITWVTADYVLPIIDTVRMVNRVHAVPVVEWDNEPFLGIFKAYRSFASLRKEKFDLAIDFQGSFRSALCLKLTRAKRRLLVRADNPVARLLHSTLPDAPKGCHDIDWNLAAIRTLGSLELAPGPMMPQPTGIPIRLDDRPLATISVGVSDPDLAYPRQRWMEVGDELSKQGYQVVFLGDQSERNMVVRDPMVSLVGKTSLLQTASLVAKSQIHLCADSATGHIAAAYGTPVVSVFGPTNPAQVRPYTKNGIALRNGEKPEQVTTSEILAAVQRLRG